jgi:predicted transcriptional regulator
MTAVRKPVIQTYNVELDEEIADSLRRIAERTGDTVENLIASAALAYADRGFPPLNAWTAEDVAAIDEGFAQIDRGEVFTQEEVEAQIDDVLR